MTDSSAEASPQDPTAVEHPVLLFDGVCNLCNSTVDFVIRRDTKGEIRFASLQSEFGQRVLEHAGFDKEEFDSLLFVEDGTIFTRSNGALRVARYLGWPWRALRVFLIVPRFIRDAVYSLIARNRYRWFGKKSSCRLPSPEEAARFL